MFNYYGSKYFLARYYPEPQHDLIIENFAGAAHYSLRHWKNRVLLIDCRPQIVGIWKYLQAASEEEILNLPVFQQGEEIRHPVPEARDLIALGQNRGTAKPARVAGKFCREWANKRRIIAESLYKIRHWEVRLGDYRDAGDLEATWFMDPPYVNGGAAYGCTPLDYDQLAAYARSRKGQVIVCEGDGATWLPFRHFRKSKTLTGRRSEVIWTNT